MKSIRLRNTMIPPKTSQKTCFFNAKAQLMAALEGPLPLQSLSLPGQVTSPATQNGTKLHQLHGPAGTSWTNMFARDTCFFKYTYIIYIYMGSSWSFFTKWMQMDTQKKWMQMARDQENCKWPEVLPRCIFGQLDWRGLWFRGHSHHEIQGPGSSKANKSKANECFKCFSSWCFTYLLFKGFWSMQVLSPSGHSRVP